MKKYIVEKKMTNSTDGYWNVVVEGEKHLNRTVISSDIQFFTSQGGYSYNHPESRAKENAEAIAFGLNNPPQKVEDPKHPIVLQILSKDGNDISIFDIKPIFNNPDSDVIKYASGQCGHLISSCIPNVTYRDMLIMLQEPVTISKTIIELEQPIKADAVIKILVDTRTVVGFQTVETLSFTPQFQESDTEKKETKNWLCKKLFKLDSKSTVLLYSVKNGIPEKQRISFFI